VALIATGGSAPIAIDRQQQAEGGDRFRQPLPWPRAHRDMEPTDARVIAAIEKQLK